VGRRLSADETALWARVMATVTPLPRNEAVKPLPLGGGGGVEQSQAVPSARLSPTPTAPLKAKDSQKARPSLGTTLDGSWDRRLARGSVEPDATVDLHGHTLTSAYQILDQALERSRARGDRVILLITGKPPRRDSERPHARGAIRAAVGDWLLASRHAGAIAAVRGASPRHGGAGALYIVLRRPSIGPKS
jgi:DNA-nicking Smr family endonuclease